LIQAVVAAVGWSAMLAASATAFLIVRYAGAPRFLHFLQPGNISVALNSAVDLLVVLFTAAIAKRVKDEPEF
jgi:threonine/homoserine/homoserine lactone efflux protein